MLGRLRGLPRLETLPTAALYTSCQKIPKLICFTFKLYPGFQVSG